MLKLNTIYIYLVLRCSRVRAIAVKAVEFNILFNARLL